MEFLQGINPLYSLSGFVVGFLVGMTGVGGGSLMTPLLILLFNVHPATAVGTDLLFAAATKTGGTAVHGFSRTIDWRVVGRLATGSVPATAATILTLSALDIEGNAASRLITQVLAIALILTAAALFGRHFVVKYYASRIGEMEDSKTRNVTIITGAVLGVIVTLSSVGAGAIGVTVLVLLYPKLPMARIIGSDIAHAVPLTLVAGMGHWWLGSIDWPLLTSLLVGSVPGILISSALVSRVPDVTLRYVLAGTLLLVAVRLLFV